MRDDRATATENTIRRKKLLLAAWAVLLALAFRSARAGPERAALRQAIVPPPTSQRVERLGQTGGLVTSLAIEGDLIFVPEGDALTILRLDESGDNAAVLARVSPNQGRVRDIAVSEAAAFLITPIGLAAVSIRDPYLPQVLSFLPGGGEAVQISSGFAFVAARAAGLRVVNVANPARPVLASTLGLPGKALALELDNDAELAFVAADEGGLRVVDVSAPDLPREVTSMTLPAGVQGLRLGDNILALSSGDRVVLVDVSHPGSPALAGTYAPPRQGRRIKVQGNAAYVADLDGGLKVFDVTDAAHPLLAYGETSGSVYDVAVQGNRAYLADGAAGLRVLDIRNPAEPELVAQLALDGVAQGLDLWEDSLLVATGESGLAVISIVDERKPTVTSRFDTAGDARDVWAGENLAYVADGPAGLAIISLLDKRAPVLRSTLYTAGEAQALGVDGTTVYVAADDAGLQIIDAARPAAPFVVGALDLPERQHAVDVAVIGKRAYLAVQGETPGTDGNGLAIADVGFRDQPTVLSRVEGPGMGLAVRGAEVLTVEGNRLMAVDAHVSSGPVLMGQYQPPGSVAGMEWYGTALHLAPAGEGPELTILETSDPAHPRELMNLGFGSGGGKVITRQGRIFVAAGRQGLRAIDIADPAGIVEHVVYDPMDTLTLVSTDPESSGTLFGAGESGWSITNVENPRLPEPLSHIWTSTSIHGLEKAGTRLYAASSSRGLLIYDVSDATQPELLGRWSPGAPLRDVLVRDGYLYLIDQQAGLRIVDPNPPGRPNLLQTLRLVGTPNQLVPISNELAYVTTSSAATGLRLIDLGHPTAGVVPRGAFLAAVQSVRVRWPLAYTLDGNTCAIWELDRPGEAEADSRDVADLGSARQVASFQINGTTLLLAADQAFVGSEAGHVSIVDVSSPDNPRVLGMMGNNAAVRGMALQEPFAQLVVGLEAVERQPGSSDGTVVGQFRIWQIENPRRPVLVSEVGPLPPFAVMAQVPGAPLVVAAGESLSLYDISHRATITPVISVTLPSPALCLHLTGDLAMVGTERGLIILRGIENGAPEFVGELPLGHAVLAVATQGEQGYLSVDTVGGLVVDLSDLTAPRTIASLPTPSGGPLHELTVAGGELWAVWDQWVSWMDVSQPEPGPSEVAAFVPDGLVATDLEVTGPLAYLTDEEAGLSVLDVSDPRRPVLVGSLDTPGHARAVAVGRDGVGYIADGECGVRVVSLQNPTQPAEIGFWHTGYALDVKAVDHIVYVADIGELVALEYDPEGEPVLPAAPQLPQPADGAMFYPLLPVTEGRPETTLTWGPPAFHCDPLTYDLYLGTENPPPLAASDLTTPALQVSDLERRQTYYWRVVARDRQGDETAGPVWHFDVSTMAQPPPEPQPAPRPQLVAAEQDQVLLLIGGLAAAGAISCALWWVHSKQRR